MPDFKITSPDGKTYRVTGPEGATREQAFEILQQQLKGSQGPLRTIAPWQQEQMVHPAQPMTPEQKIQAGLVQQAGLPFSAVDFSQGNLSPLQRAQLGFLSDTPAEQRAWLEQQYPGAKIFEEQGTFGVLPPESPAMQFPNPPGFEPLGSPAEFAGRVGPGVAGGVGGSLAGSLAGPMAGVGGAMAGVAGAEGLREAAQLAAGTQRETLGDLGTRVGVDVGMELIPAAGAGWKAMKAGLRKRGMSDFGKFLDDVGPSELQALMGVAATEDGLTLPKLLNFQKSQNPVLRRIEKQTRQFSREAQMRLVDQANRFARVAQESGETITGRSVDDVAQMMEAGRYQNTRRGLAGEPVDPTTAGKGFEDVVQETLKTRKGAMRQEFGKLDALVDEHQPIFDITGPQEAARQRVVEGSIPPPTKEELDALGGQLPEGWKSWINVAEPNRKLSRVNHVLSQLDPEQDYAAVKEIRRQVGEMLRLSPEKLEESNLNLGQIKRVYGELSDVLNDPRGVSDEAAAAFRAQNQEATKQALRYYDTYHLPDVRRALRSQKEGTATELYNTLAQNPSRWGPEIRAVIDEGGLSQKAGLQDAMTRSILQSGDPLGAMRKWQSQNPQAFDWLFPNKTVRDNALQTAKVFKDLDSSAARAAEDAAYEKVGFAMDTLKEHMGKRYARGSEGTEQARRIVAQYGGLGSEGHNVLRKALYQDALEGALKQHDATQNLVVDPKILAERIREMEKSGVWKGIMTSQDRRKLDLIQKYARETFEKGDAGTGLTVASQVGQVRHGDPTAIASIFASRRMADWLTREDIPFDWLFTRLRGTGSRGSWLGKSGVSRLAGALARSYGQGTAAEVFMGGDSTAPTEAGRLPPEILDAVPGP
jgi:hypothetical protein